MVRHSFLNRTVPFLSKNVDRKRCHKRLLWDHVRPAAPGGRNKDEYSGGARADIDLPRIAPRRRGGGGRPPAAGLAQAEATKGALDDWGVTDNVVALCYDTTQSW